uniref:Tenascin C n=1 Tax=Callorhinchus milii TaxID=7868 RepID=A0A4W3HYK5_CALMI
MGGLLLLLLLLLLHHHMIFYLPESPGKISELSATERGRLYSGAMGLQWQALACILSAILLGQAQGGVLKDILRHKRSPVEPEEENVTLPLGTQPINFNHVYNINVPLGALCSVDLDSPDGSALSATADSGDHHIEHTVDGENQIVFTHRINIPRQACACGQAPDLQDLLQRLELLEGQVSSLRDQCANGGCCGNGRVDVKPFCGGHGNYSTDSCGGCGRCVDGACQCFEGYAGAGCDRELCPVDCGQHGRCADGECVCDEGFTDHDCSEIICPRDCYDRGRCVEGQCFCDQGFTGEDCGELSCPSDCHDRGACVEGRCLCREGFAGEDCGELSCPGDCRQRGACVRGRCVCGEGYAGEDCGRVRCPHDCHDRGRCVDGRCLCQEGFAGEDCGEPTCPGDCHQRGRCANGQCVCDEGFAGADCGELACPDRCNNRGRCLAGQCVCIHPFTGPSCALLACANHCSHRGRCVDGRCVCDEGYIQEDLSPAKNLKVTEVTPETLDLEWYNEVRVNEYLITYVPTSPGGLQLEMRVDGDKMSSTVQELEPGVEYFINVYAILNNHRSVPVSARVATHLPTPDGLRFKSVKETSVHVAWDPLDIPFDGWELVFKKEDNGEISHNLKQDQLSVTQTGLAPGEEYDVSLYIIKNQTRGPEFKKPLTTMIDSPSEVEVNKVTDTTAHVTWFKPAARIDGINLSYGTPGGERTTVQLPDTESTHSISGLEPDTEYQVSLVSNRGQMQSVPATNTFRTDIDAPQNLRVVTQTDQSITLQWKNTRAPAGSYRVKYAPLSGGKHMETIVERSNEANTKITMTGLQPGTEYGFGVSAFQGNNRESAPATINAATELDDPKDLEVSERTVDSITLRWHRPQAVIKQYRIYYITPSGQRSEQIVRGDAITFILVDLDAGLEYTITLVAERDSEKSQGVTITSGEISNITVSDVTSGGLRVSWTAAIGVYDHFVIEYRDEFAGASDKAEVSVPGDALSADLTGLSPSTPYNITLYGIVEAEPELGNLMVSDITPSSFKLSWTALGPYEGFDVEIRDSDGLLDPINLTLAADVRFLDVPQLSADTDYEISFYGLIHGQRTKPLYAEASTEEEPELGNLIVSDITSGGFTLSWTAEDEAFQYFVIEVRDSNSSANPLQQALSGKTRTADISGLRQGTGYHVNVFGAVHGRLTSPLTAVTATEENPKLENLVVSDINSYGFRVTWDAVDGAYESFNVVVRDSGRLLDPLEHQVSGDQHTIDITGLITGIGYDIYVSGVAKGQQSKPLFAETTTGILFHQTSSFFLSLLLTLASLLLPGVISQELEYQELTPTVFPSEAEPELDNLSVSNVTSDGFTLTWTTDDSAFDIFHIKIRDSQKESAPLDHSVAGELRTADIRGLRDGTEYEITVHGIAEGQRSQALSTVANTALGAPRGLRFENVTDSTVTLRWDHPRAKVNSFRITYVPTDGGAFQSVVVDGTKTKTTLYKLIPATEYRITIVSLKGFEESESISDTVLTVLDNPSALGVVNVTDSEALLVWQPTIAAVDGYVIAYTADYGITETEQVSGNTVQAELISLHPGTHYTVWMHAVKGSLQSLVSSTTFTTAIDPPTDLRASEITTNNALLSWKVPTAQITGYTLTLESTDGNMQQVVLSDTDTSYSLAQLVPSMRYHVKLQANKGSQRSKIAETFFTAGRVLYPHPKDCSQTLLNGEASSGLYTIFLNGNMSDPLKVYCDMTTDGGGWVVFQRRQNGNVNFYRNWRNYSAGFGDPSDEFWLGLQSLHKITSHGRYELRVDLRDEGNSAYAVYDKFLVTDPRSRYKLHIGEYSGTAGDSLTYHQGRPFSTKDRDNDIAVTNCALSYKGAWWYKNCHRVNLNGVYGNRRHSQGINWYHWKGHEHSISFVEMKLRPHNFRDLQQRKRRQPAAR